MAQSYEKKSEPPNYFPIKTQVAQNYRLRQSQFSRIFFTVYLFVSVFISTFADGNNKQDVVMDMVNNVKKWTREDFLALLERGRQIKERRTKEAQAKYAERQRRKREAAESGYYDLEWV